MRAKKRPPLKKRQAGEGDPLTDRAQVRMFTLAEYVSEETSGKLYISGAGLEWTGVPVQPDPNSDGHLLSCYVALRLAFPGESARDRHIIEVRALRHDDDAPAGPDSLFRVEMSFDFEDAPADVAELSGNFPIHVANYPISADADELIDLHLVVDDIVVSRMPVQLLPPDDE